MTVRSAKRLTGIKRGQSICVNGVCLSVTRSGEKTFSFDVIPETLRRANLGELKRGDLVNLERALKAGGRLDGHYVQGHIEGRGRIVGVTAGRRAGIGLKISYPARLKRWIVPKGYVAVDGISLTIGEVVGPSLRGRRRRPKQSQSYFTVYLIPLTFQITNLGSKRRGDELNLETDILLRSRRRSGNMKHRR